jgi:hypothetical protein
MRYSIANLPLKQPIRLLPGSCEYTQLPGVNAIHCGYIDPSIPDAKHVRRRDRHSPEWRFCVSDNRKFSGP